MPFISRMTIVGTDVASAESFEEIAEIQYECVSNIEENLIGYSPLDSNNLDHMVNTNSEPTLSGVHSHLTRHIQG